MTYLLIVLPIAAVIIWLVRKERARRIQTHRNEEEFLASMRANPLVKTSTLEARAEPPLVPISKGARSSLPVQTAALPQASGRAQPVPPIEMAPAELPVADMTPRAALSAPLAAPRDGRCMVCKEAVDVRASDQSRWGVKIPEPGSERLTWVHFHCLATRLAEGQQMRGALARLVSVIDSEAAACAAPGLLAEAVKDARQTLGQ